MITDSLSGLTFRREAVRRIAIEDASLWLAAGWGDFRRAPILSLAYGGIFVIAGYLIVLGLNSLGLGSLVPVAIAAFFLVAPLLAVGLYDVSRRIERGDAVSFEHALRAFNRNPRGLGAMGLVLMLSVAAWMQVALLIFMLFFHASPPPLENFVYGMITSPAFLPFLMVGTAAGAVIAIVVFAISVVSIPMLLDHDMSASLAMTTSVAAFRENWRVLSGWAATIVLLIGIGFATAFIGLAVTLPLLAFASWHAYRDIVE